MCPVCGTAFPDPPIERSGDHALFQCRQCDVQAWEPRHTPGGTWYDLDLHYAAKAVVDWLGWYHEVGLRRLPPSTKALLDIGAADGRFVYAAARRGIDAHGIDFSERLITLGNQRYGGRRLRHMTLEDYIRTGEPRVDAVTLFETIEHVEEPMQFLRAALRTVTPGGTVIISTPNRNGYPHPPKGYDEPPHHFTRWSVAALRNLAERAGIRNVSIETCPPETAIKDLLIEKTRLGIVVSLLRRHARTVSGDRNHELETLKRSRVRLLIRGKDLAATAVAKLVAPVVGRWFPGNHMVMTGRAP